MSIRPNRSTATAWRAHWRRAESPEAYEAPAARPALRPLTLVPPEPEAAPFAPRDRRHGGHSQDQALYSCGCGFRFEALVSTSVDCPRCGGTQAW
jgi:hypothetical protein